MRILTFLGIFPLMALSLCGGWDARLAASYLDARQQEWLRWPRAKATGGTCLSCHTGATYLLARHALRRVRGESRPTSYETGLLQGLRARAGLLDAKEIKRGFAAEPGDSALLILPGGAAWEIGGNREAAQKAKQFPDAGIPVAAICGAALGLARMGLLDDRCHTGTAAECLRQTGYKGQHLYRDEPAVTHKNLVTANGTATTEFAREILTVLQAGPSMQSEPRSRQAKPDELRALVWSDPAGVSESPASRKTIVSSHGPVGSHRVPQRREVSLRAERPRRHRHHSAGYTQPLGAAGERHGIHYACAREFPESGGG